MRPTNPLMLARASRTCTASRIARTSYRSYSDASYPFTKPANTPTKKSPSPAPNAAWPFTKPNSPVSVAPPSGKVDDQRPGPAMESSELIDREAVATDELHPDYAIVEDYTTSYERIRGFLSNMNCTDITTERFLLSLSVSRMEVIQTHLHQRLSLQARRSIYRREQSGKFDPKCSAHYRLAITCGIH